jgi:hypothetical protein
MRYVVMERGFKPPINEQDFQAMAADLADCARIYRAHWQESFLARDGSSLTCCFKAPDTESIRMMSRGDVAQSKVIWAGTVCTAEPPGPANVLVERCFGEPVTLESVQAIEDAADWCLQQHKVTFLRTYFSTDQKRMICLYRAPDAEAVRQAQRQANMPVERIWACQNFTSDDLFA